MKSFTQEERLAFPTAEAPLTSLAEKIERLKNTRYISKTMLDEKVRQPVVCKQSCHKLLRSGEHAEVFLAEIHRFCMTKIRYGLGNKCFILRN